MKVKDLIEQLNNLDPELDVVVSGYESSVDDCTVVEPVDLIRNVNTAWYFGSHDINHDCIQKSAVWLR